MDTRKQKIKVLLVDDQPLFVHSLAMVIQNRTDDIEIVGIEMNGEDAVNAVKSKDIDIIIMDIKMPIMNGVEATKRISAIDSNIKIMMLTTFDEDDYVLEALEYGAKGYLLKTILPEEVITAIRALYAGINQISPAIITKLTERMKQTPQGTLEEKSHIKNTALPDWFLQLSHLEKEILELVVKSLSNKEISSQLNLAEQTVKNYLTTIYEKMGVNKRSQLIMKYVDDRIAEYKK